jgi:hypothetical protein
MDIIAHRGFWNREVKQNSAEAFAKALENGFGIEFDLRDLNQEIVVSHDMPIFGDNLTFVKFLEIYKSYSPATLAINIKSDGMQEKVAELIKKYQISNYFLFDMSVPDAVLYCKKGLNIYTRQSEYEEFPSLYKEAQGVWIDEFYQEWVNDKILAKHINSGKKLAIVSPELHKRSDYLNRWNFYKNLNLDLAICTDYPDQANKFFNE